MKLVAAENAASYLPAIPFTSSKDVMDYFSTLEEEPREVVIAAYLDNKHRVSRNRRSIARNFDRFAF